MIIKKAVRVLCREGWSGAYLRVQSFRRGVGFRWHNAVSPKLSDVYGAVPERRDEYRPLISVIVPNFNHQLFLEQRLESIYAQTYKNIEVILMDDASSDRSLPIMRRYRDRYAKVTRLVENSENSGGVFHQWKKGFSLAAGELVWIAESDDFCDPSFLEEMVGFFQNPGVMLAFCRTDFVDASSEKNVWSSEHYLADVDKELWDAPFIRSAHALVEHGWGVKNLVANVSSALMRHPGELCVLNDPTWFSLRLCGDWVFYLHLIRGGLVGYTPATTNYYRQHENGTSVQTQKTTLYYREFEQVARYLLQLYRVSNEVLTRQRDVLITHWRRGHGVNADQDFANIYSLDRAAKLAMPRKNNVMMAAYALAAGGGETFPIFLANQLKSNGWSVTFFNCREEQTVPGVRKMLDPSIPIIEIDGIHNVQRVCKDMAIEVVHSHHAWVDITFAGCIQGESKPRQVVTLHGMYEMIEPERLPSILRLMDQQVDAIVYTAEKNLVPFPPDFRLRKGFTRINNALRVQPIQPMNRPELRIGVDDFVLCLISRALPEKGWQEAIDAVERATAMGGRPVHLLLIGEGPEYERLRVSGVKDRIHLLGYQSNIRDYFAMSDMGFLPTRFAGESFPLVLIDSLMAGKPVLASKVGEIAPMLEGLDGTAGCVFGLEQGTIPVEKLARCIRNIADDRALYDAMVARVPAVAAKFDIVEMTKKYEALYHALCPATPEESAAG
jgi:glycosyltransferase involved in cell wall biosynthesis